VCACVLGGGVRFQVDPLCDLGQITFPLGAMGPYFFIFKDRLKIYMIHFKREL
jgi:hypothetical protein